MNIKEIVDQELESGNDAKGKIFELAFKALIFLDADNNQIELSYDLDGFSKVQEGLEELMSLWIEAGFLEKDDEH